jgi:glutamate dehydrogenase
MARDSFHLTELNGEIEALDTRIPAAVQTGLFLDLQDLMMCQTVWFLRNAPVLTGLEGQIRHYRDGIATLAGRLDTVLPATVRARIDQAEAQLAASGVPKPLAARLARLDALSRAPDVILVATQTKKPIDVVARAFFGIGARLGVDRLAQRAGQVEVADYFDRLALGRSVEGVFATQRGIAVEILRDGKGKGDPLTAWTAAKGPVLARTERSMAEMIDNGELTLAKVTVAGSYLQDLLST